MNIHANSSEHMWEIENLKKLKSRYFRFWDGKQFDDWLDLFTDDAMFEVDMSLLEDARTSGLRIVKSQFADSLIAMNRHSKTVHRGHTPDLELASATTASGIWSMDDIIERDGKVLYGHGYYHESYRKVGGKWLFSSVRLVRTRLTAVCLNDKR